MSLIDTLLGRDTEQESPPPKPDDESKAKDHEFTVYEVTLEYRNGDAETFECYGRYTTGGDVIKYNVDPVGRAEYLGDGALAGYTYNRRAINYEVLSREPIEEQIGTETWELTWTVSYEKRTHFDGRFKRWDPVVSDITLELTDRSVTTAADDEEVSEE